MEKKDYKPKHIRNIIIIILIVAAIASFSYFTVVRTVNYNLGEDYYLARLYDDAISKLEPLGNYKDSKSLFIRSLYKQADIYYSAYDYISAMPYYEKLATILPETNILIDDTIYIMAILEGVNERYDECLLLLNDIKNYDNYNIALKAAEEKNNAFFVTEHRTHIRSIDYKTVISYYLNSK